MPRSASRDLADRFAGPGGTRHRYFSKFNHHERWKIFLSRIAMAGVVIWGGFLLFTKKLDSQVTHGPLANVHAPWDAQCEACHRDTKGANFLDARGRWRDFTCEKCHSAPVHHANIKPGDASEDCSSCHHDHAGRDASLVKLSDDHCVRCHGNLAEVVNKPTNYANKVTDFAVKDQHPEFRSLEKHVRHLKFSHSQHMTAGMILAEGGKGGLRVEDLPEILREKYRQPGQRDDQLVQLDCRACHLLDSELGSRDASQTEFMLPNESMKLLQPPRASGKYFQPINYDMHCKTCHPTKVGPTVTSRETVIEAFNIPHRTSIDGLSGVLEKQFAVRLLADYPELSKQLKVQTKPSEDAMVRLMTNEIIKTVSDAKTKLLQHNCNKCHDYSSWGMIRENRPAKKDEVLDEIHPPSIPTIWMKHAKFDHTAHRAMNCKDCHPNSGSKLVEGSYRQTEREPVDILGRESCIKCHSPAGRVKHGCTDCHSYHHGDFPLQGRGAEAFNPKMKLSLFELLEGK